MKQRGHRLAVGSQSIVGQATARKEPWIINDVNLEPLYYANPLLPETKSELVMPLIVGERVLGALDVQSERVNAFSPDEVQILQILTDQLAIAVWNSTLFGKTQATLAQHRLLQQISIAASTAASLEQALSVTVEALHQADPNQRVMVMMFSQGSLQVSAAAGYEGLDLAGFKFNPGEGIPGQVAQSRQSLRINDLQSHPEYLPLDPKSRSELAVPIFFSDRTFGVLDLSSAQVSAYDETDQEILVSLGNTLGAILANNQLVQEVRQQVERKQMLFDITSRIRHTSDIPTILETSAREIARAVGARRAQIGIQIEPAPDPIPGQDPVEIKPVMVNKNGNGNGNGTGNEVAR
jgi:sigma-B regulation protein RsbU (phosphoserine phosphatase)